MWCTSLGASSEEPHKHLKEFHVVCSTMRPCEGLAVFAAGSLQYLGKHEAHLPREVPEHNKHRQRSVETSKFFLFHTPLATVKYITDFLGLFNLVSEQSFALPVSCASATDRHRLSLATTGHHRRPPLATTIDHRQPPPSAIVCYRPPPKIEKLNWKNYKAWSDSVELWFLGQGFHDHLEKQEAEILEENKVPWLKLDYQLCVILWQSVSLELLEILRSFKTCYSFWTNASDVFAHDVQHLFDSIQKIVSLQQTNHDMVSHIAKTRATAEELKGLLVCNSVEETIKRINKLLMVLILRSLHPDYEHVRDQILSSEQIPSMNSLVTRLLGVPTITKGDGIAIENSTMVASCGRGRSGRGTRGILRNGKGGHDRLICSHYGKEGHLQNRCYDLIGWLDKTVNISSSDTPSNGRTGYQLITDKEYQEFLRLKSNNHT
ncbi:hypothetical protein CR513_30377, partial [Mucuna pruriens]